MARTITVAALQTSYGEDMAANIQKTEGLIRDAAAKGAQVILPSELFQGHYFCVSQEERWFSTAYPWREHPCVTAIAPLAGDLGVVIPISIFEREGPHYYNSVVIADADGSLAGVHIFFPDPWHKARHNKRRLIQPPFVKLLCQKLSPGGYIHCATDWEDYAVQMLEVLGAEPLLQNTAEGYAEKPSYRPLTKFENRGLKLGHGVWDLVFTKR